MGDQKTGSAVPAAISQATKLVDLPSGLQVTVVKWSFTRALEVMRYVEEKLKDTNKESLDSILKGSAFSMAMGTLNLMGKQMLGVVRLSVIPEDRDKIQESMPADDVMVLVEATLEMNLTEVLVKKVTALWTRFEQTFMGAK